MSMGRFVILFHDRPGGAHWDFMLESGPVLKTWALAERPDDCSRQIAAALPDHRLAYLDYEGPISGGRGSVVRWDTGTYTLESQNDDRWAVLLSGTHLTGRVTLEAIRGQPDRWQFAIEEGAKEQRHKTVG